MIYESQYYGVMPLGDFISHHGIKGQKWGVRRFQNKDGTRTEAGKARYGSGNGSKAKTTKDDVKKTYDIKSCAGKAMPAYRKFMKQEKAMIKHEQDFAATIGSKKFNELFERGLNNYISNDAEGKELKQICRDELNDYTSGKWKVDPRSIGGFTFAYYEHQKEDPKYDQLWNKWHDTRESFDKTTRELATQTYSKHGSDAMKAWSESDGETYDNDGNRDIKLIDYMIYEECRVQYKKGAKNGR